MTRLVTFGCSLTYGQYLDYRDTQSWPAQLGKMLSVDVVNISEPGASNKKILYNILDFDFEPDDICVIVWTNPYRWVLYTEDEEIDIGAWQDTPRAYAFVEHFWQDYDIGLDTLERANHAHMHIPVKSYHVISGNAFMLDPQPDWSCANWLDIDFQQIRDSYPKASDGKHQDHWHTKISHRGYIMKLEHNNKYWLVIDSMGKIALLTHNRKIAERFIENNA